MTKRKTGDWPGLMIPIHKPIVPVMFHALSANSAAVDWKSYFVPAFRVQSR